MSLLWAATVQPPSSEMSWVSPFDIVQPPPIRRISPFIAPASSIGSLLCECRRLLLR